MVNKTWMGIVAGLGVMAAAQASAALLVNGNFENHPAFPQGQNWGLFYNDSNPVPGWTSLDGTKPIELGWGSEVYGVTGYPEKNTVMELDSTANVAVYQGITTTVGASYILSFDAAMRANGGYPSESLQLQVSWNGTPLVPVVLTSYGMTTFTFNVIGAGSDTLQFTGLGTSDSYGALVDNVQVVPEPSTVIAAALLLLPFGISTVRTLRRNA